MGEIRFMGLRSSTALRRFWQRITAPFGMAPDTDLGTSHADGDSPRPAHWDERWSEPRVWSKPSTKSESGHSTHYDTTKVPSARRR
jgi:hypothetical protein